MVAELTRRGIFCALVLFLLGGCDFTLRRHQSNRPSTSSEGIPGYIARPDRIVVRRQGGGLALSAPAGTFRRVDDGPASTLVLSVHRMPREFRSAVRRNFIEAVPVDRRANYGAFLGSARPTPNGGLDAFFPMSLPDGEELDVLVALGTGVQKQVIRAASISDAPLTAVVSVPTSQASMQALSRDPQGTVSLYVTFYGGAANELAESLSAEPREVRVPQGTAVEVGAVASRHDALSPALDCVFSRTGAPDESVALHGGSLQWSRMLEGQVVSNGDTYRLECEYEDRGRVMVTREIRVVLVPDGGEGEPPDPVPAGPHHNAAFPVDVNGDRVASVADVLGVITALRDYGHPIILADWDPIPGSGVPYVDVDNDGLVELEDALLVIAYLRELQGG